MVLRMINQLDTFLYIWRALLVGILVFASLFLLSFLLSSVEPGSARAKDSNTSATADLANSPNLVTNGMVKTADGLGETTRSVALSVNNGMKGTASAFAQSGKIAAQGAYTGVTVAARGVGSGLAFVGRTVGKSVGFVFSIPANVVKHISSTSVANSVIRPSDHAEVPIIDPDSPELQAALAALPPKNAPPTEATTATVDTGPQWPIHGQITTEFGVAHWPYQRTHTGLDISATRTPGVTPVKPFRPGRVIETIHSTQGLGNHVIVDHGNGVTSVYGHLASISVQTGQEVKLDTVLGREGTTGVSTGTHLHFEVRVHGQAANPRQFIGGNP
jgi:hypothetical protein